MFARVKKSGPYEYLQIVENRREGKKTIQRVIATIGRVDQMQAKGEIDSIEGWRQGWCLSFVPRIQRCSRRGP